MARALRTALGIFALTTAPAHACSFADFNGTWTLRLERFQEPATKTGHTDVVNCYVKITTGGTTIGIDTEQIDPKTKEKNGECLPRRDAPNKERWTVRATLDVEKEGPNMDCTFKMGGESIINPGGYGYKFTAIKGSLHIDETGMKKDYYLSMEAPLGGKDYYLITGVRQP